jgi:biopolymer transport protein ExbD
MTRFLSSITPALVYVLTIGCASSASVAPFNVTIRDPATSCSLEVNGRLVTKDELFDIARPKAKSGRRALIDADMKEAPYRCIGSAIWTLQRAGFKDIGFVSEPKPWP